MPESFSRTVEIVHAAEIDAIEKELLQLALERTGSQNGGIFLWDPSEESLQIDFHVVDGQQVALPNVHIRPRSDGKPNGIALHVAQTITPYLTNNTETCELYAGYFLAVKSIIAVPIPYQDRAIGVISVSSPHREAYTTAHLAELEALAVSSAKFLRRAQLYRHGVEEGTRPILIKGLSRQWMRVEDLVERVSPTDAPVLIRGESGTGKELVANAIHFNSRRASKPFVTINCAAIPETLLESMLFGHVKGAFTGADYAKTGELKKADGGTLFLDELGELTPALQAKVLRALEQGEIQPLGSNAPPERVDVRLLAATNRDLEGMRAKGLFRDDLYFRLAVITIRVPPLRSYLESLESISHALIEQANLAYKKQVTGLSAAALGRLQRYHFPGNVRELRNLIEHAVIMTSSTAIQLDDLPVLEQGGQQAPTTTPPTQARLPLSALRKQWLAEQERHYVGELLDECDGDIRATAEALGIDRASLYRLLKKRGISLKRRISIPR
jgi:two-component system, NtrC family, response regulator HydG